MSVKHWLVQLLVLASIFSNSTAQATVIGFARTTIDWGSLVVNTTSNYTWSGHSSSSEAEATNWTSPSNSTTLPSARNPDTSNSWGATNQSYTNGGTGAGSTTSGQLQSSGSVTVSIPQTSKEASARVIREGFLTLTSDAFVTISFAYELDVILSTVEDDDWAFGVASFDTALIGLDSGGGGVRGTTLIKTLVGGPGIYDQSRMGTMTMSGNFLAGERIGFTVDAIAYTQGIKTYLPTPPAFWLLFSSLVIMLFSTGRNALNSTNKQ